MSLVPLCHVQLYVSFSKSLCQISQGNWQLDLGGDKIWVDKVIGVCEKKVLKADSSLTQTIIISVKLLECFVNGKSTETGLSWIFYSPLSIPLFFGVEMPSQVYPSNFEDFCLLIPEFCGKSKCIFTVIRAKPRI